MLIDHSMIHRIIAVIIISAVVSGVASILYIAMKEQADYNGAQVKLKEDCSKMCGQFVVLSCSKSRNLMINKDIKIAVCLIEKDKYNVVVTPSGSSELVNQ